MKTLLSLAISLVFVCTAAHSRDDVEQCLNLFNHHDKNSNGQLNYTEFHAALIDMDAELGPDPENDPVFQEITAEVDPNEVGYITREMFIDFLFAHPDDYSCEGY